MFRSLQARLTAGFVAIIAVTILAVSVSILLLYAQVLHERYRETYRSQAEAAAISINNQLRITLLQQLANVNRGDNSLSSNDLAAFVDDLSRTLHVHIRVLDTANNRAIAESRAAIGSGQHLAPDDLGQLPSYVSPISVTGVQLPVQVASIAISHPLTDRAYQQGQFVQRVVWITLGALLLAFVLGGLLSERLTAPFRVLTRAAARFGEGNLQARAPEGAARAGWRDEAGELAYQFNRMAGRLEESFALVSAERDSLRQFVADVSHELRTPLTALRTFNDLLRDGAGEDATTRREFLDAGAQQIERLEWLTRNLLDLSRLEAGITRIEGRPADLADTLRRAVRTNKPAAMAKGVTFALDAPPLVIVHDPPRMEQALGNILNNAVKFSPPGGTVGVRLCDRGPDAAVEVSDNGPGIPPNEAARVFERFYRGQDANRGGEGSGLGLAITKAIADAHRGAIALESAPDRGTTMRLIIPHAAPTRNNR